jgi:hypothetical protein
MKLLMTVLLAGLPLAHAAAKPDIKAVMKAAMKGDDSLFKKVTGGSASDADAKKLADCLKNLDGEKPPKGEQAAFQTKVAALIKAAEEVAGGKKESIPALKEAGNCKACHSDHKKS